MTATWSFAMINDEYDPTLHADDPTINDPDPVLSEETPYDGIYLVEVFKLGPPRWETIYKWQVPGPAIDKCRVLFSDRKTIAARVLHVAGDDTWEEITYLER